MAIVRTLQSKMMSSGRKVNGNCLAMRRGLRGNRGSVRSHNQTWLPQELLLTEIQERVDSALPWTPFLPSSATFDTESLELAIAGEGKGSSPGRLCRVWEPG